MSVHREDRIFQTSLGEVVKAWREHRGLRAIDLAARSGRTKAHISEIERNRIKNPDERVLIDIAHVLEIPPEYLVTRHLPEKQSEGANTDEKKRPLFAAPIRAPQQESEPTTEELQQILKQLEDIQSSVKKLISQKENTNE